MLNRDVWSSDAVKTILREHFIFWQQYQESEEAQRYMTFYPVTVWPHIAVWSPMNRQCFMETQIRIRVRDKFEKPGPKKMLLLVAAVLPFSDRWKSLKARIFFYRRTNFSKNPQKIIQKSSQLTRKQILDLFHVGRNTTCILSLNLVRKFVYSSTLHKTLGRSQTITLRKFFV